MNLVNGVIISSGEIGINVYSVKQVAVILSVSEKTVYRILASGELKGFRVGKLYRIAKESIEGYLANTVPNKHYIEVTTKGRKLNTCSLKIK